MKRAIILGLSIILLISCNSEKSKKSNFFDTNEIIGLASPIQLNPEITEVYLEDYFIHPEKIDSFSLPEGIQIESLENNVLELIGEQKIPIDVFLDSKLNPVV